jgi:N-formylglutamate deformylase
MVDGSGVGEFESEVNMSPYTLTRGALPLLVSVPHAGTVIPDDLKHAFTDKALQVEDTDWHLEKLYAFAKDIGASMIEPTYSRYVIDLNRPPDNQPMYPGSNNTELCPTRAFTSLPIYRDSPPDAPEIERRKVHYWQPYHNALADELARLKAIHGYALLWDGHSIKSELPWLFEGRLPDLNIGTSSGNSCAAALQTKLEALLQTTQHKNAFSHVFNGRFKGGYITRTYGNPANNVHAVQLEQCWSAYMEEVAPFELIKTKRTAIDATLRALLQAMLTWQPAK